MKAGPYIRSQIESACARAVHFREARAAHIVKAAELETAAAEADAEAARWAAGTDYIDAKVPS